MHVLAFLPVVLLNLIPLVGVLYFDWQVFTLLVMYWLETVAIALFYIPRILSIYLYQLRQDSQSHDQFFGLPIVYFGIAGMVALSVVQGMVLAYVNVMDKVWESHLIAFPALPIMLWALLGFVLGQGIFFMIDFVQPRRYRSVALLEQALLPFPRVIVLNIAIMVGGLAFLNPQSSLRTLIILVVGKSIVDIAMYWFEGRSRQTRMTL